MNLWRKKNNNHNVNLIVNNKNENRKFSQNKIEKRYNFYDLIQKFLNEISKKDTYTKSFQNESDVKIIILSQIKLFIYENLITSNMTHLNKLKQKVKHEKTTFNYCYCRCYG